MPARRENAIKKIRKLESELDRTKGDRGVESREREICRLQILYKITDDEIRPKKKMFTIKDGKVVWNW